MAEFISFEPTVEVIGQAILATIAGMGDAAIPYLKKYQLDDIKAEQWYLQQSWLDFLKHISQREFNSVFDLVGIGIQIPEHAIFPPDIVSIPTALKVIDVAYYMNHRNGKIGHYHAHTINDNQIDVVCENPYPCDFDYGLIYGMVRRFRSQGVHFSVQHDDNLPCRQKGAETCTYHVTWG